MGYNIPAMSRYAWLLFYSGIVPFLCSLYPPLKFWRHWRALALSLLLVFLLFGGWDVFATWRGHWSFDPSSVGTFKVANLPLEEALFFAVIGFCSIFTWEALQYLKRKAR